MLATPLFIHNIHLKTELAPQCYADLPIHANQANKSKKYGEIIGNSHVTYLFYPQGTVMMSIENTNSPFKLESEVDRSRILTFFGQVRDRLIKITTDPHERLVSDVMTWDLTECDLNRDVPVNNWLQVIGIKIQVRRLDHLFRIYIKSMGKDTVCRTEESIHQRNLSLKQYLIFLIPPRK